LIEATNIAESKLCTACFTGKYPMPIPEETSNVKLLLEEA
jgi:amidophosphoribosyltransferase